jgi:hypothetical protein
MRTGRRSASTRTQRRRRLNSTPSTRSTSAPVAASVTAKSLPDMLSVLAAVSDATSAAQNRASTTANAGAASSDSISTPPSTVRQDRRAQASLLRRRGLLGSVFPLSGSLYLTSQRTQVASRISNKFE